MAQSKYARLLKTVVVTGGAFMINLLIQLILTPLVTRTVGTEAYGFVTLAKNFAQYAMIITMALNAFASRYIAIEYHNARMTEARRFFSSTFFGDAALATLLLGIALTAILFLEKLLNIPAAIVPDVKLLFLMVFANFWLVTVFTVFESSAYVSNRLDITGNFKACAYLAEALTLFFLYRLFPANVFYVGIGLMVSSLVVVCGNLWICRRHTPELRPDIRLFSLQAVKKLVLNGIWNSVNALGELLNNGLDLLVCNLMLTPLRMGQLAIAKTVHSMFYGLFVIINAAFQPMFLKSYAADDRKTLLGELRLAMKVSGMLSNVAFAGFAALGLCFFRLWIPQEDTQLVYQLTLINCITLIPGGPMQPLYYIYTLTVKNRVPCLVTIAGGLLNVAGMFLLIRNTSLGAFAVVWTTAVVMMVINFITNPMYMAHVLGLPLRTFYPEIIRNVLSCGVITGLFLLLRSLYSPASWLGLALCAILYAVIGAAVHLMIICSRSDLRMLAGMIKRKGM